MISSSEIELIVLKDLVRILFPLFILQSALMLMSIEWNNLLPVSRRWNRNRPVKFALQLRLAEYCQFILDLVGRNIECIPAPELQSNLGSGYITINNNLFNKTLYFQDVLQMSTLTHVLLT